MPSPRSKPKTRPLRPIAMILSSSAAGLKFPPHNIAHLLDETGRYREPFDREFRFRIKLFHYTSRWRIRGATWHGRRGENRTGTARIEGAG